MERGHWNRPVTYEEDDQGGYRTITSTEEAARALLLAWPVDKGKEYFEAQRICLAVLEGRQAPELAREAFLKAAAEAGVFVRDQ